MTGQRGRELRLMTECLALGLATGVILGVNRWSWVTALAAVYLVVAGTIGFVRLVREATR